MGKFLDEEWHSLKPEVRYYWEGLAAAVFRAVVEARAADGQCPACGSRDLADLERRVTALEKKTAHP